MATIQLKAGMVWKGAYDASVTYDKLDVVCNADKTQIAVCKQGGSGIPLTNSNYWEVSIDASGIIALLEDALAHGEIYTMKIGSVTTGATSSATIVNNHQTHETILNLVLEKGEKGEKGDKGERGEKGDTTVIDPSTATAYTLYNSEGDNTDGAMTQAAVTRKFKALDETYAQLDGYYETLGVGMATNLKGQNVVDAEFAYRKSGGNVEVQDGNAMIEAIKGNTVAWNQLSNTNNKNESQIAGVTFSVTNGIITLNGIATERFSIVFDSFTAKSIPQGHKFFLYARTDIAYYEYAVRISGSSFNFDRIIRASEIITTTQNNDLFYSAFRASEGDSFDNYKVVVPQFIDLTLIYGEGNEPSTPEQFEQDYFNWFGKPLTYEPYDAGSLRNTKISALKTTGFNLWDEEWEVGGINNATGEEVARTDMIRPINYINVIPNTEYYCAAPSIQVQSNLVIMEYDADKKFIKHIAYGSSNRKFRTTTDTRYIRFIALTPTYNNDICINLSDPNRNGEYEPYKESTLPLDVTTLTGKLNGEGSSVVVFPNGMEQGDEVTIAGGVVKAIRRRKVVDISTLDSWNKVYNKTAICAKALDAKSAVSLLVCDKLSYQEDAGYSINVGCIGDTHSGTGDNPTTYFIGGNFENMTSEQVKSSMQGVMLSYELAEPEVYVLDDFNLPKLYPVANGGTEEQLSNSPNSLPATLSIRYGLNAAAFIQNAPKNYISKESMSNFLSNLGSAMGGTWSMVWNSSTNKYDFSFTQNRSVDVEQPIEDK